MAESLVFSTTESASERLSRCRKDGFIKMNLTNLFWGPRIIFRCHIHSLVVVSSTSHVTGRLYENFGFVGFVHFKLMNNIDFMVRNLLWETANILHGISLEMMMMMLWRISF